MKSFNGRIKQQVRASEAQFNQLKLDFENSVSAAQQEVKTSMIEFINSAPAGNSAAPGLGRQTFPMGDTVSTPLSSHSQPRIHAMVPINAVLLQDAASS